MHITTGLVGTRYILPALTLAGQGEVALKLVMQTEAPSWGYMVEGAAQIPGTIWEEYSDLERELVDGLLVDTVIEVGTLIYGT